MGRASLLALLTLLGCGPAAPASSSSGADFAAQFLNQRAFRRESLESAVENPNNDYSALRLAEYATESAGLATGWDSLEVWDPQVRPLTLSASGLASADTVNSAVWDGRTPASDAEWLALGRRAFELWPVEIDDLAGALAQDAGARQEFGMWTDDRQHVAGLVHVLTADGREHVAWSCSGCHARPDANGHLSHGPPAVNLDRGAMSPALPDGSPSPAWAWGKGRLDVTADGLENPTAIPDLRAASHQSHLHCEATLKNSLPALAVRIETLIIDNTQRRLRPPRELAVALALYITSLGRDGAPGDASAAPLGARLFEERCSGCHHADGSVAAPILTEVIGTDRRVADSPARGTGHYRVPSLWAVSDRGQLLHDGTLPDLEALLDPERPTRVPGHLFGLDLAPNERAMLIDFVNTIGRTVQH